MFYATRRNQVIMDSPTKEDDKRDGTDLQTDGAG